MSTLFTSTTVGDINVKNRVFMAPLTRNRAHDADDIPNDLAITYYQQRAEAGLIIAEGTQISPMGKGYVATPGIYSGGQVEQWKKITAAVHAQGGKIVLQLWHVGRISHVDVLPEGEQPLAPSGIQAQAQTFVNGEMADVSAPRMMTQADIKATVNDYRKAAANALKAGFDGVEVHAANGYLLNQFISSYSNQRDDEYGGSVDNRTHIIDEVLGAVVSEIGAGKVGIRLSPTGTFNDMQDDQALENYTKVIELMKHYKLAYMHIVERFPGMQPSEDDLKLLDQLIKQWPGFYIANGDYDKERAQSVIDSGAADAVSFGRPFIANPDLPTRLEQGVELNEPDQSTFYGGGAKGYTDYPTLNK
ncbi:MAG: alkene reductase [Pseudomonadota bacterium]|nr:alkene reductase [Pseudomonadota bacterium]